MGVQDPDRAPHALFALALCPLRGHNPQTRVYSHFLGLFSAPLTTSQLFPLPQRLGNEEEASRTGLEVFMAWLTTILTNLCS